MAVGLRVFVYGTLLAGEANHGLLARARPLGAARTLPAYALHDLGAYPALAATGAQAVEGELYEVDAETLLALDALEGHPGWYERRAIALEGGAAAEAYFMPPRRLAGAALIASGSWRRR